MTTGHLGALQPHHDHPTSNNAVVVVRLEGIVKTPHERVAEQRRAAFREFELAADAYNKALVDEQNARAALERCSRDLTTAREKYREAKVNIIKMMPEVDPVANPVDYNPEHP